MGGDRSEMGSTVLDERRVRSLGGREYSWRLLSGGRCRWASRRSSGLPVPVADRHGGGGRVIPAGGVWARDRWREGGARGCPPALDVAVVAGDICHDRLIASGPARNSYRRAFGVRPDQRLVLFTSTWGPHSLFARHEHHLPAMVRDLSTPGVPCAALVP